MKVFIFSLISALILSACGGGSSTPGSVIETAYTPASYTGLTTAATIDSDATADSIGTKTAEATIEAIVQDTANAATPFPSGISISSPDAGLNQALINIATSAIKINSNLPAGTIVQANTLDLDYTCGTVDIDDQLISNSQTNLPLNGTATLNNVCYQDLDLGELILNGSITFTQTVNKLSLQFSNFSVSDGTSSQTIDMTVSCDFTTTTCTFSSDYIGDDGKTYRLENLSIIGSDTGPYYVDATFYHPDFGYSTLTTTNAIYFNCANGQPSAGTIQFTGANGSSGSITFNPNNDCDGYSGTWDNSTAAVPPAPTGGDYSGSWLN